MTSYGGRWALEKLEVISAYLDAHTTALKYQPFQLIYVDAFAESGLGVGNRLTLVDDDTQIAD